MIPVLFLLFAGPVVLSALGRVICRRMLFLEPEERTALAFPIGVGAGGLLSLLLFWLGIPLSAAVPLMVVVGSFGILNHRPERMELVWAAGLIGFGIWNLALQWPLFALGGGSLSIDWIEHYLRARWFHQGLPGDYRVMGLYNLPARPPLVNILAATLMAPGPQEFWTYQIVMGMLHAILVGPAYLIVRRYAPTLSPAHSRWAGFVLLSFSPLFIRNATYLWTKGPAAAFSLLAVHLYLSGRQPHHSGRIVLAFALGAMGIVAHYSSALIVLPLALDFVRLAVADWGARWRALLKTAALSVVVLGLWIGFSVSVSGLRLTLQAASQSSGYEALSIADRVETALLNLRFSLIPYWVSGLVDTGPIKAGPSLEFAKSIPTTDLKTNFQVATAPDPTGRIRVVGLYGLFTQTSTEGLWSDRWLAAHSGWLPGAIGLGALLAFLVAVGRRPSVLVSRPGPEAAFWLAFVPVHLLVALASGGVAVQWGLAHVLIMPLVLWIFAVGMAKLLGARRLWRSLLLAVQGTQAVGVFASSYVLFRAPLAHPYPFAPLTNGAFALKSQYVDSPMLIEQFGGGGVALLILALGWIVAGYVLFGLVGPSSGGTHG